MIEKIRFQRWDGAIVSITEKDMAVTKLPKWINQFIPEINIKNITLVIFIDQQYRIHYHFESLDADLDFRMQIASEKE